MTRSKTRLLATKASPRDARGFSLLDLLVSIAVIALLIAILLPSLSSVQQTARRAVCGSNVRQLGLGLALYAGAYQDAMPPSAFRRPGSDAPEEMVKLFVDPNSGDVVPDRGWDGLGHLHGDDIISTPGVFYCPSHKGEHPIERYRAAWTNPGTGPIVGNYHYRGTPRGDGRLSHIRPASTALIADALRTRAEFNHGNGANVLRADMSVFWFMDTTGEFLMLLPADEQQLSSQPIYNAWNQLDKGRPGGG
jgi:type II secretory pathway pseudopilin PulG